MAISPITLTMSAISLEDCWISWIASIARCRSSSPRRASASVSSACVRADTALSSIAPIDDDSWTTAAAISSDFDATAFSRSTCALTSYAYFTTLTGSPRRFSTGL